MIIGMVDDTVVAIFDWAHSVNDVKQIPKGMKIMSVSEDIRPGYIYENGKFIPPRPAPIVYDPINRDYYSHDEYRKILHSRTDADVLMAIRKIREGDTSYDWNGWLKKLDEYNSLVSETKNQPGYPDEVEYPEYPVR